MICYPFVFCYYLVACADAESDQAKKACTAAKEECAAADDACLEKLHLKYGDPCDFAGFDKKQQCKDAKKQCRKDHPNDAEAREKCIVPKLAEGLKGQSYQQMVQKLGELAAQHIQEGAEQEIEREAEEEVQEMEKSGEADKPTDEEGEADKPTHEADKPTHEHRHPEGHHEEEAPREDREHRHPDAKTKAKKKVKRDAQKALRQKKNRARTASKTKSH